MADYKGPNYRDMSRSELIDLCKKKKLRGCGSKSKNQIRRIIVDSNKDISNNIRKGEPIKLAQKYRLGHTEKGVDGAIYKVVELKSGPKRWKKCEECRILKKEEPKAPVTLPGQTTYKTPPKICINYLNLSKQGLVLSSYENKVSRYNLWNSMSDQEKTLCKETLKMYNISSSVPTKFEIELEKTRKKLEKKKERRIIKEAKEKMLELENKKLKEENLQKRRREQEERVEQMKKKQEEKQEGIIKMRKARKSKKKELKKKKIEECYIHNNWTVKRNEDGSFYSINKGDNNRYPTFIYTDYKTYKNRYNRLLQYSDFSSNIPNIIKKLDSWLCNYNRTLIMIYDNFYQIDWNQPGILNKIEPVLQNYRNKGIIHGNLLQRNIYQNKDNNVVFKGLGYISIFNKDGTPKDLGRNFKQFEPEYDKAFLYYHLKANGLNHNKINEYLRKPKVFELINKYKRVHNWKILALSKKPVHISKEMRTRKAREQLQKLKELKELPSKTKTVTLSGPVQKRKSKVKPKIEKVKPKIVEEPSKESLEEEVLLSEEEMQKELEKAMEEEGF